MQNQAFSRSRFAAQAPADTGRGAPATDSFGHAEYVTFRLAPGVSEAAFLKVLADTAPLVSGAAGFVRRQLSCDADGLWTDHVEWREAAAAHQAAEALMADPAFAPFMEALDPQSVHMRHGAIRFRMGN